MADESIREEGRHQIEQVRELESEELQVEEAEDLSFSSDGDETSNRGYGGSSASDNFTFDTSLASLHTYLGEVEETHHRLAFLDGGAELNLPILYLEGVVLFPEATLPLRVLQPNYVAAIERSLSQTDGLRTIGIVRVHRDSDNGWIRVAPVGTTAEIRQYRRLEDGSLNVVTRGQQRFRLKRRWNDVEGAPFGVVEIIQEDLPLRTPLDAVGRLAPLRNLHAPPLQTFQAKQHGHGDDGDNSDAASEENLEHELLPSRRRFDQPAISDSDDENFPPESGFLLKGSIGSSKLEEHKRSERKGMKTGEKLISGEQSCKGVRWKKVSLSRLREVPGAFWPYWVYRMYDSYCLAQSVAAKWKQVVGSPSMDGFVKKPDLLSFYIASKIPVSESTRQELLEIDGVYHRLCREIELLESFDHVRCKTCQTVIGRRSDMLVMSSEGPLGAYVNPNGYVHEIMTLYNANGLALYGHPVKEYSWFPGYAWSVAICISCESQMGWLFTATDKNLKPRSFWGIRCSQVADDMH